MKRKSPSVYVCVMQTDGSADAVGSVINSNSYGFPIYSSGGCEYALNQNGSLGRRLCEISNRDSGKETSVKVRV